MIFISRAIVKLFSLFALGLFLFPLFGVVWAAKGMETWNEILGLNWFALVSFGEKPYDNYLVFVVQKKETFLEKNHKTTTWYVPKIANEKKYDYKV